MIAPLEPAERDAYADLSSADEGAEEQISHQQLQHSSSAEGALAADTEPTGSDRVAGQSARGPDLSRPASEAGRASSTSVPMGSGQPVNTAASDLSEPPTYPNLGSELGASMLPSDARDAQGTDTGRGQSGTRDPGPGRPGVGRDDAAGVGRPAADLRTVEPARTVAPSRRVEPGLEKPPRASPGKEAPVRGA